MLFQPMFLLQKRRLSKVWTTSSGQKWDSNLGIQDSEAGVPTLHYAAGLKIKVFLMSTLGSFNLFLRSLRLLFI